MLLVYSWVLIQAFRRSRTSFACSRLRWETPLLGPVSKPDWILIQTWGAKAADDCDISISEP